MDNLTMFYVAIGFIWFIIALIVGNFGKHRSIGYVGAFYASLLLSPVLAMLFVLASDKRTNTELNSGEKFAIFIPLGIILISIGFTIYNQIQENIEIRKKLEEARISEIKYMRQRFVEDSLFNIEHEKRRKENDIKYSKYYAKLVEYKSEPVKDNIVVEKSESINESNNSIDTFLVVEQMPEFIGDNIELYDYIKKSIKYPETAKLNNIQGSVFVNCCITESGKIEKIKIMRGVNTELNNEAIRVVTNLLFKPGMQRGKPVNVNFTFIIPFRIEEERNIYQK